MTNAILVAPQEKSTGLNEKPVMYSTVIERHQTGISHQVPQPTNIGINVNAARSFVVESSEPAKDIKVEKIQKGAYSIPIKIDSSLGGNPTLSSYETPNFIFKKEKVHEESKSSENLSIDPEVFLKSSFTEDVNKFVAELDNSKTKAEKIGALEQGKTRLQAEMKIISEGISKEMKELLYTKEVALKLSNLNNYYSTKINRDQLSRMKLSDIITFKNILREKLQKEIQGFRTYPGQYQELEKINPGDIEIIVKNIKLGMGQ